MEEVKNYNELIDKIESNKAVLLFFSAPNCSVCHADLSKIEEISNKTYIPFIRINIDEVPEAAGQFSVFTAPAVLLYYKGREYHRQARIVNFEELKKRINILGEAND